MGKKLKIITSLLKNTEPRPSSSSSSSWSWPSCHQPRTLSFRANNKNDDDDIFKTINSAYLDATLDIPDPSFLANSDAPDPIEAVIRGLRSDRLFFEPDQTSPKLEAKSPPASLSFKDSLVLSLESQDPYVDFRKSMEEMVEAHGAKDWESLEELLCWYLRVNGKSNHGYIVGAFVDLLVALAFASASSSTSSNSSHSPSSPLSFNSTSSLSSSFSTPCASCLQAAEEVDTPTSSLLLEQVKEEIQHEDEASSSSNV